MRQGWLAAVGIATVALTVGLVSIAPLEAVDDEHGFGLDDFKLVTGQDLLDICTVAEDADSYWEAQAFCFGYFRGGADFHRALATGPRYEPIICPGTGTTIRDAVAAFVDYGRAHPEQLTEPPMDVVFRAVTERWPCA